MDSAAADTVSQPGTRPAGAGAVRDRPGSGAVARAAATLRAPRLDPYWVSGVLFVLYTTLSVCRHRRMLTMSWDLGIFEQAIQAYARLQAPVADLKGPGTNILGDHFSPVTALIAPVYRAFPSPVTLLVVQAALFAVSAVPVTRLAARRLGRGRGLAIGVAYGLSWGVQRAVDFDFHEIAFAMPLLAFALEAVVCRRWRAAVLWAAPLVLVKEDLGVTAAAVGVLILLRQRSGARDRRAVVWGGGLVAFGLAATAVALGVVIPGFNSTGSYDYWNKLDGEGGGPAPVIPLDTAVRTLLWTVLPTTGLLALRSPLLIVALPTLSWRFLSHDDHYWGTDWHYSAVLMPVVFIALTDALETARRSGRPWLRSYAHQLPAAVLAAALALSASLPLYGLTLPETYRIPASVKAAERLLERIPDGSTVESDVGPISRLVNRCRVFWIGDTRGIDPDYVALRIGDGRVPQDLVADARRMHPEARYAVLGSDGGYAVLRRVP
ncbi:membrane protein [Streptomyces sp. NRRL B-1568]|nr:membrane protein [Streptomyces sp. NRRL B-1568]